MLYHNTFLLIFILTELIVKNLLSFARQGEEEHESTLIKNIIKDSLGLLEKQVLKDGIKLTVDLPPDLPEIRAHSQQIQQVFLNIIGNARHALKEKYPSSHNNKVLKISSEIKVAIIRMNDVICRGNSGIGVE